MLAVKGELEEEHGRAAFGILLFQDLAVVPIMVLIPVFAGTGSAEPTSWWNIGWAIGVMLVLFGFGRLACPWLFRLTLARNMTESFTAVIFIALLGSAWLASHAGLSMALGAFLMGLAFSGTAHRHGIEQEVTPFKNLLLALFFVSVGLSLDLTVLAGHTAKLLMHVLVIVVVKAAVLYAAARSLYMGHRPAVRLSFLLSQGGEFGFVVLSTLLASGVVTPLQFASGTMVIALTMIATPMLDRIGITLSRRAGMNSPRAGFPAEPESRTRPPKGG
jgi:glutathione-regulated potassium-efflux system protein KefB